MAARVAAQRSLGSARSHIGGAKFDASSLGKYMAQSAASREPTLWERSLNPVIGSDGLNGFQRADKNRRALKQDSRLQQLIAMSDGTPKSLRDTSAMMAQVEQLDRENGVLGPRQDVTKYGAGTDFSRYTEGMSQADKIKFSHLHVPTTQVTSILEQALPGFKHIDKEKDAETYDAIYTGADGEKKGVPVNVQYKAIRHYFAPHNDREGYEAYKASLGGEGDDTTDFGDFHDHDFYDPVGQGFGRAQAAIAAKHFLDEAIETNSIPTILRYGGLMRQRDTVMAIRDAMGLNENGHDSGVSKIGEMNTSDVFLGDKESWRNNDLQNDEEIYTEIAADQDALYEIIKQVVDSKIAQGKFKDGDSITIVDATSCERAGYRIHAETGQGLTNGMYVRPGNCDISTNAHQVTLSHDGSKIVGPHQNVYDRKVIKAGFDRKQYESVFGSDPTVGHENTDHSGFAWKVTKRGILPGRERQLTDMCTSFRSSLGQQDKKAQNKWLSKLGASSMDTLTDFQIKSHLKKERNARLAKKREQETALLSYLSTLQGGSRTGMASSVSRSSVETDTTSSTGEGGRDSLSDQTKLPSQPVLGGVSRIIQGY